MPAFPTPAILLRTGLLAMLWLFLGTHSASASHLVGGELTYKYLDAAGPAARPYRYELTARVYFSKEGNSIAPDGSETIPIAVYDRQFYNNPALVRLDVERGKFSEITLPALPGCAVTVPRVTLATYTTTVELPARPAGYLATINASQRNSGITNVEYVRGSAVNLGLKAEIPPPSIPNSSPTFSNYAQAVICLGEDSFVLNNAYDADGDRLSYQFNAPSSFVGTFGTGSISYAPGYSSALPFGSTGAVSIDARTGLARYRSLTQGTFLLAVDVQEFRTINGQEVSLGTTRRDIQIVVRACSGPANQPPAFAAASLARQDYQVEEGQRLDFGITATDPEARALTMKVSSVLLDGPGSIEASVNGQPGTPTGSTGGSVEVTGTATATGNFRLQAGCGLARAQPYDVLVTVTDEGCGSKTIAAVFRVTVTPPPRVAPPTGILGDDAACVEGTANYAAAGPVFGAYRWTVQGGEVVGPATGRTVQVRWLRSGRNRLSVSGTTPLGCATDAAFKEVAVGAGPLIAGPTTYCRATSTGLRYTIAGPSAGYQWTVTDGRLVSGQGTNSVVVDIAPGATAVLQALLPAERCPSTLRVSPDNRCLAFFNVITPNGDGRNDVFAIENVERYPNTALTVYNRWGRQVYQSRDYRNTYGGEGASAGLYYYLCRLENGSTYKGWFEVIR